MKQNILHPEQILEKKICLPDTDTIDICIFSAKNYISLTDNTGILSGQEQKKAASLRQEKDRLLFLTSHILLREAISSYLHCSAKDLTFETELYGKPRLINWGRGIFKNTPSPINFNLSHSGDYAALAFSTASPIGIDIEKVRPNTRMDSLVRRFFHPDEYDIFSHLDETEQREFLFRRWTVREAFLKGLGSGLTLDPRLFCITPDNHLYSDDLNSKEVFNREIYRITKSQKDYSFWRIASVTAPADYFCSVAYKIF